MKNILHFRHSLALATLFVLFLMPGIGWGQVMLAGWTFDATPSAPNTPTSILANLGTQNTSAYLYADGTNGSSNWITATSGNELTTFAGSTINDPRTTPIAGNSYCPLGGTALSANGKSWVIKFSMTGFQDPILTFATRYSSNTGFSTHQWAWSTDGSTFTNITGNTAPLSTSFTLKTLDLSSINNLDNASTIFLRITFSGCTNATANNRLDNFVINATTIVSSNSITTGLVSSPPFCLDATTTATGTVAYTATGTPIGQTLVANLSDASGSFTTPTNIGTIASGLASGNLPITIPANTASGTGYKIRVDCPSQSVTGTTSAAFEIINGANNATTQAASIGNTTSSLSWTNPTGCYDEIMVVAKAGSAVTSLPSGDGSAYTANLTFGSGTGFDGGFVVYEGVSSPQTVSGLTNGTNYFYKFFTRKGTNWSSGVIANATPTASTQATDYFKTQTSGNWDAIGTWESSSDNTNWISATITPTNTANTITVLNTHTVTVTANVSADQLTVNSGGKIVVNGSRTLTIANGADAYDLFVSGTIENSGTITATGAIMFDAGGYYKHTGNTNSLIVASWNANSTCEVTGITSATAIANIGSQNSDYGTLIWNCPSQTAWVSFTNSFNTAGDFIINSSGGGVRGINLVSSTINRTFNIGGNLTINNGKLALSSSNGVATVNIAGNLTLAANSLNQLDFGFAPSSYTPTGGGNYRSIVNLMGNFSNGVGSIIKITDDTYYGKLVFSKTGSQTYSNENTTPTMNGIDHIVNIGSSLVLLSNVVFSDFNSFTVEGTLNTGSFVVDPDNSFSDFTISSGSLFVTANNTGIFGAVQSTGVITFSSLANYEFNGASTGTFTTTPTANTVNNLTINNAAGVALGQNLTVNGVLGLTSGVLSTGTNTLLAAGTVARTSGHVNGNFQKNAANGNNLFETGSTVYAPVTVNFSGVSGSVILTAKVTDGSPAAGSGIDPTKKCNNYWTITKSGTGAFTSYDAAFDLSNTTNTGTLSNYKVRKYDSGTWTAPSSSVAGNLVTATGLLSFSDFEIGEGNPEVTTQPSNATICAGDNTSFTAASTSIPTPAIQWQRDAGSGFVDITANLDAGTVYSDFTTGTLVLTGSTIALNGYLYRAVFTNVNGSANSDPATLIVSATPTLVTASASPNPICEGSTLTLSGTATGVTSWSWSGPNSFSSSAQNPTITTITTDAAGVYTLTASNACGAATPASTSAVVVNATPTISGTLSVLVGATTQLTGSGTAATTDPWISATPTVATVNGTGLVTGVSAGTSVITYTDINGCSATATVTVTTASSAPTIASFTPTGACTSTSATVIITGTNFTGVTAVKFNGIDAVSFTEDSPTQITAISPTTATTGKITITNPGGTATSTENFNVGAPTVNAGPDASITILNSYTMLGSATNYTSVLWSRITETGFNGNGTLDDATILGPVFTGTVNGTCKMQLAVTGYSGCPTVTDTMLIVVLGSWNPLEWDGSVNSNWHNAANWDPDLVPGAGTNVTIPADTPNYPTLSAIGHCKTITIKNGASLIDNGYLTVHTAGGVTVEHPAISAGQWHNISTPVSGVVSGFFFGQYLRNHLPSTGLYEEITETNVALQTMKGYALWPVGSAFTTAYTGGFNPASNSYALSTASGGWNLIGNPFTSSIDWDAVNKTGIISGAIYIEDAGNWATYVQQTGTNAGTQYIAPTQGFFVHAISASNVTLGPTSRIHHTTNFYKGTKEVVPNLIRLEISGNGYKDEAVVRFTPEATSEFDDEWDAYKFYGSLAEAAQIYTLGSTPLSINSLPETNIVPVGLYVGQSGTYTIAATEINDLRYMQLEDTKTGEKYDIANQSCTFTEDAGTINNRFILHFSLVSTPEEVAEKIEIYSYQKTVYINMREEEGDMFIYNIAGQLINSQAGIKGTQQISIPVTGNYIVKVITNKKTVVKKVLIN